MNEAITPAERQHSDDEIDLGQLARRLWRGRGIIASALLLSMLLVTAYALLEQVGRSSIKFVESYVSLGGIVDQKYPNGSSFSPSDFVSEEVLSEVIRTLDLQALSSNDLRQAISVQFGHPDTAHIRVEWGMAVREAVNSNASAAALAEINSRFSNRIERLNGSTVSIQVNHHRISINEGAAIAIAHAVPQAWQNVFVNTNGLTAPPEIIPISGLSPPNDLSTTRSLLEAQQFLFAVRQIASTVQDNPRLSSLRSQRGFNAAELRFQIERFNSFYLNPLLSGSIESNDNFVAARLQQLRRERTKLADLRDATRSSLSQIATLRGRISNDAQPMLGVGDRSGTILSLDESGLGSVIDLAQQAQLNQYIILLFEREWDITGELVDIDFQIAQLTSDPYSGVNVAAEAEVEFLRISQEIETLFERLMDDESLGLGSLYSTQIPPQAYSNWDTGSQRLQLLLALSVVIGLILGMFLVLVRSTITR